MSIINDALKKLQNQIGHSTPQASELNTNVAQEELIPAQKAGFQPAEVQKQVNEMSESHQKQKPKQNESHLVIVLGILCLLIGLFVPIVKKQSVVLVLANQVSSQWNQFKQSKQKQQFKQTNPSKPVAVAAVAAVPKMATPAPAPRQKPARTIAENTAPAATIKKSSNKTPSRLIINGIMTKGEQNLALVDGQIYEEGDMVDGVKILKITTKGVTIIEDGEERTIKIMGN